MPSLIWKVIPQIFREHVETGETFMDLTFLTAKPPKIIFNLQAVRIPLTLQESFRHATSQCVLMIFITFSDSGPIRPSCSVQPSLFILQSHSFETGQLGGEAKCAKYYNRLLSNVILGDCPRLWHLSAFQSEVFEWNDCERQRAIWRETECEAFPIRGSCSPSDPLLHPSQDFQ